MKVKKGLKPMKLKLVLFVCLFFSVVAAFSCQRLINEHWLFQRLPLHVPVPEIKNQGSDWKSQFNIEHVQESLGNLCVSADTLAAEFELLHKSPWEQVDLPHTAFVESLTVVHPWQGVCYYQKKLILKPDERHGEQWIEFGAAMHLADVWINGRHVMQHAGGYTPFVVDATGLLKSDSENEILVRLDNRNNSLIPPGKPLENLDFCYYSGLYRDVKLIVKPNIYITHPISAAKIAGGGVFVTTPYVSDEKAEICIQTEVANSQRQTGTITLRQSLFEWNTPARRHGHRVMRILQPVSVQTNDTVEVKQHFMLSNPRLWSPDSPHLYMLRTEIIQGNHIIDVVDTRVGIRHFEMSRERGLLINGKPLWLTGSNRHQEYPYVGNALSNAAQYRDIYQIRHSGFNVVRLGHYLQDPSVLDACDEVGLLAIEPIPGWQFYNDNPVFVGLTYSAERDMIRRDRNHPCILMWETTLNESWPPDKWKDMAVKVAHEEQPGNQCFTSGDMYGYHGFDVSYNDWDDAHFSRPNDGDKPGFIREYYDYEFGGHYSTTRVRRGDGCRALIQNAWNAQWSHNKNLTYRPWTMGDAVWSMYDYNRGCCDNICYSGVADIFRLPKYSLHFFSSQVAAGSFLPSGPKPFEVFIADSREIGCSDTVLVYGNVDEVALFLNGTMVGRKQADNGPDTSYKSRPDGGNCRQLHFPPFTFTGVKKDSGCLTAVGFHLGREVVRQTVCTPHNSVSMKLDYFESGRKAECHDLLIIYVRLFDANGTPTTDNETVVSLSVQGGDIVGPRTFKAESGIASFLIRTGSERKLQLRATAVGLHPETREIKLKKTFSSQNR